MQKECEFAVILRILGRKWTIKIFCELIRQTKLSFSELMRNLQSKYREEISARSLSNCLQELKESHLINREVFNKTPPVRVVYSLSEKGDELKYILTDLKNWLIRWEKTQTIQCIHNFIQKQV